MCAVTVVVVQSRLSFTEIPKIADPVPEIHMRNNSGIHNRHGYIFPAQTCFICIIRMDDFSDPIHKKMPFLIAYAKP